MRTPSDRETSLRELSRRRPSRRQFLRVGAGATAVALAGCVGGESTNQTPHTTRTTEETIETTEEETSATTDEPEETTQTTDHVAWQVELEGEVRLGPTVLGDALYVGDSSGLLRALDPDDGTERWRFETAGSFFSGTGADRSPVLADGTLYAVSGSQSGPHGENFAVSALDAETGQKRWTAEQGSPKFLSLFGVADGRAFVGTSDDALSGRGETLRALDVTTGEKLWTAEIGDSQGAAVTDDAVYVAAASRLDAFDAADGAHRFGRELPGRLLGTEVGEGVVYAGFREGRESGALALDPQSGETRWSVEEWFVTSMLADESDGSLYVGGEHVASFRPDGTRRWRYDTGGLLSAGALVGDRLFLGGNPVTALSTADGSALWSNPVDAEFGVVEGADEKVVAVQRENSTEIDVFDAETGDVRFTFDVGGKWLSHVTVDSGTVYAGSDAGVVYALGE